MHVKKRLKKFSLNATVYIHMLAGAIILSSGGQLLHFPAMDFTVLLHESFTSVFFSQSSHLLSGFTTKYFQIYKFDFAEILEYEAHSA